MPPSAAGSTSARGSGSSPPRGCRRVRPVGAPGTPAPMEGSPHLVVAVGEPVVADAHGEVGGQ